MQAEHDGCAWLGCKLMHESSSVHPAMPVPARGAPFAYTRITGVRTRQISPSKLILLQVRLPDG